MSKLITRIGRRNDPNRALLMLQPRACGSFGETIKREGWHVGAYGNCFYEALRTSFYWADIPIRTVFDDVNDIARAMYETA